MVPARAFLGLCLSLAACGKPAAEPAFERVAANSIAHGERVSGVLGCTGCHGRDMTGEEWSDPGFAIMHSANLTLTAAQTTPDQLKAMIVSGRGTGGRDLWGMPSFLFTQLAEDDMTAVLAFLDDHQAKGKPWPAPVMLEGAKKEIAEGILKSSPQEVQEMGNRMPPNAGPAHARARYIVRATCAECHQLDLRGGTPYPGAQPRPDLRIVASYDLAAFERLLTTGKAPGNREVSLMSEVARGRYAKLTPAERRAIFAYLQEVAKREP
jgi:cytochrome c553